MRVLFAASEVYPHAKSGGLADVITALSSELCWLGYDARLVLPAYPQLVDAFLPIAPPTEARRINPHTSYTMQLGKLENVTAPVWLVFSERVFSTSRTLYPGNRLNLFHRFSMLSHAAASVAAGRNGIGWKADILHAHDWHAGLAFNYLDREDGADIGRVFSIHNIAFQGAYPRSFADLLERPETDFDFRGAPHSGRLCFMKEALLHADKIATVSENYATEITGPQFGFGFESILSARKRDLSGITNGVDYRVWHPEQDHYLPICTSSFGAAEKSALKKLLQQRAGFPIDGDKILCTFTNRLTHQKMIDVILDAITASNTTDFQFLFHGVGEKRFEDRLRQLQSERPHCVHYLEGFREETEHLMLAGADLCLSPSRFEPCGLNPLYGMRYGAIPFVTRVGGFVDNIHDVFAADGEKNGTGIYLEDLSADAFLRGLGAVSDLYADKERWRKIVDRAKRSHFSWRNAAESYLAMYQRALRKRRSVLTLGEDIRETAYFDQHRKVG